MNTIDNNLEVIQSVSDFSLSETLECGQCFRFYKVNPEEYMVLSGEKCVRILQKQNQLFFYGASQEEVEFFWNDYFDFSRNYGELKQNLAEKDEIMGEAVGFAPGIRILRQEFFECLISFILSQNNHIPRIKGIIEKISKEYGTPLGNEVYGFPTSKQLLQVSEDDFRKLGTGFRAKYIVDAVKKVEEGKISQEDLSKLSTEGLREQLVTIHGVGRKIADCVLLFSFGRYEVFPIDVWVKRIMSECYFEKKDVPIAKIFELAEEKYGEYAGFAQQYLFYYARQKGIGKKSR